MEKEILETAEIGKSDELLSKKITKEYFKKVYGKPFDMFSDDFIDYIINDKFIKNKLENSKFYYERNMNNANIIENMNKCIKVLKIGKIAFGDEINVNDWQDKMTLWYYPIGKEFINVYSNNEDSVNSAKKLKFDIKSYHNVINNPNLKRDEDSIMKIVGTKLEELYHIILPCENILYIPENNIIVVLINPFIKQEYTLLPIYEKIINNSDINNVTIFKFVKKEEKSTYALEKVWNNEIRMKLKRYKTQKEEHGELLNKYDMLYVEKLKKIKECNRKLLVYENIIDNDAITKKILNDIKKIKKYPFIDRVKIGKYIRLYFKELYIPYKIKVGRINNEDGIAVPRLVKKSIYIGEIYINIYPDRIFASSKERDNNEISNAHPHINRFGSPCFGNINLAVKDALINLEYQKLVKLLYSWITTYNEEDSYEKIGVFYEKLKKNKTEE